jgi:hypothetical protein
MKTLLAILSFLVVVGFVGVDHAFASRPVPKTITGCVANGSLHSSDGYEIWVRNLNLAPYEGKRIQLRGNLLPGDNFYADW